MHDRRHHPLPPQRPHAPIDPRNPQAEALRRRQSLDEQLRAFRSAVPHPHIFRRRPPG